MENWQEDKASETLAAVKQRVDRCWAIRKEVEEATSVLDAKKKQLVKEEAELKVVMQDAGVQLIDGEECVYEIIEDPGYQRPDTPQNEEKFRLWFIKTRGQDAYEKMFKMHASTQKSFIKQEYLRNKDTPNFSIPGVPSPSPYEYLKPKKKKK